MHQQTDRQCEITIGSARHAAHIWLVKKQKQNKTKNSKQGSDSTNQPTRTRSIGAGFGVTWFVGSQIAVVHVNDLSSLLAPTQHLAHPGSFATRLTTLQVHTELMLYVG